MQPRIAVILLLLCTVPLQAAIDQPQTADRDCKAGNAAPLPLWLGSADTVGAATVSDFCADFLEGIPLLGRSYQDVLSLAPGVTDVDGDGNPNGNGARQGELQGLPDGVNGADPGTGGFGQSLNIEALAAIHTVSTGASAVLGGAQGGYAALVTRTGANELDGAVKFFYRSDLFDSDGAGNEDVHDGEETGPRDFQSYSPFFRLGGPLFRDHAWYFLALQYVAEESRVDAFSEEVASDTRGWSNFLKLNGAVQGHRLSLSVHHDPLVIDGLGLDDLIDPESAFEYEQGGTQSTFHWAYPVAEAFLLEVLASHYDTEIQVRPQGDARCPASSCDLFDRDVYSLEGNFISGPYFRTVDDRRRRDQVRADVAFSFEKASSHRFQAGLEWGQEKLDSAVNQDPVRINEITSGGFGGISGTVSFIEAFPRDHQFATEKDTLGGYIQDVISLPRLTIQLGLRLDREEIEVDGWSLFDPVAEAQKFLQLASLGSGLPPDLVDLDRPRIRFDLNGDGKDTEYCGTEFGNVDRYDNDLVTGFTVNENGTYVMVGDETMDLNANGTPDYLEPDGMGESFFQFVDGGGGPLVCLGGPNAGQSCTVNADCSFSICGSPQDGTASFDPALVGQVIMDAGEYGNVADSDSVLFDPTGGFSRDAQVTNPNCDQLGEDAVYLYNVFTRHQFDLEEGPVDLPTGGLIGEPRRRERFRIENDNLAPRLALAWDPAGNSKSRVFATWGRYYGALHLNAVSVEGIADVRTSIYDAADVISGNSGAQPIDVSAFSTRTVDRNLETPFTEELVLGGEYRIAAGWSISLRYVRRDGRDQLQDVDRNHFVQDSDEDGQLDDEFGLLVPAGFGGFTREPDGLPDLFVRNPLFNQVLHVSNVNSSEYRSYQLMVTRHLNRLWQMNASYGYSEATGDAGAFDSPVGNDPAVPMNDTLVLDFDQTHVVKVTAMGFLPHGQTLGGTVRWASGLPYSVVERQTSYDSLDNPMFRTSYPEGPRNNVRNEGIWNIDLSYRKQFTFDGVQAGFGVEVFNLLDSDDLIFVTADRGSIGGSEFGRRFGRRWQLGLEVHF